MTGQKLCTNANNKTQHCQSPIQVFCKLDKSNACVVSHVARNFALKYSSGNLKGSRVSMKNNVKHHVQRLATRMLQAELCQDPNMISHILNKAKKHKQAIKTLRAQQFEANPNLFDSPRMQAGD